MDIWWRLRAVCIGATRLMNAAVAIAHVSLGPALHHREVRIKGQEEHQRIAQLGLAYRIAQP